MSKKGDPRSARHLSVDQPVPGTGSQVGMKTNRSESIPPFYRLGHKPHEVDMEPVGVVIMLNSKKKGYEVITI